MSPDWTEFEPFIYSRATFQRNRHPQSSGASAGALFAMLSREFMILVIIALLIASPLAYYQMHKWLMNYQYKTELSWWIFALSGLIALLITLVTISFQTLEVSVINPIKSLRSE